MHYLHLGLSILFYFTALGNATCATWTNIWEVYRSDTVYEAARLLGLPDYQVIERMNPGINVEFVSPAQQITVPYSNPVSSPATWTTTSCSHILHLRGIPNTKVQSPETHTQSSPAMSQQSNIASAIVSAYNSATAGIQSTQSTQSIRPSNTKADSTSSTEQSHSSPTQPSNIPMPTTSVSNSPLTTKAPLPQCNLAGNFYTRNETQLAYSQHFCELIGDFNSTSAPVVTLVQDDKEHFYMFSLEWLPNCQRRGFNGQDWKSYCSSIMRQNYILCINRGQGGYTDSDCLRYSYRPLSPTTYSSA